MLLLSEEAWAGAQVCISNKLQVVLKLVLGPHFE